MNLGRFNAFAFAFLLALVAGHPRPARADTQAALEQIEAQNKAFSAAYENGDVAKMKAAVKKAISLGEKSGIAGDPVMAETYVLAAILEADGNENMAASVRYFVKALKLKPDLAIPKGMGTSTVKAALKQARTEAGEAPAPGAPATPPAAPATAAPKAEKAEPPAKEEPPKEPAAAKPPKEDKTAQKEQEKLDKQKAAEQARADAETKKLEKQRAADQARADAEAKKAEREQEKVAKQEREASDKALADAKTRAQQLEKEKADRDKQLADSKGRAQQLEKERADRDKQLTDAKARVQQLEARAQQLEKEKADRDKQLADAKARIQQLEARAQQLEKEKVDRDKQLADARAREGKEREAREKVEHERQLAEAKQRDAENKRKETQQNRERLFAGPELPSRISEPLLCEVPDEAPLRTDLFVHCVARPNVKARSIVFYYRVAGSAQYYSLPMERTSKGWHAALIPGARVVGKVMQYYAEALDAREAVVARNGKESSPNILTLKPGAPRG